MAPAPESADSEAAPSKGRSAPAAAHVDLPTRPKAFGIAAPPPSAQPVAPTAAQPEPLSPLASGLAGIMKVMDAPFAWMPLPIKRACGWLAVAMLVAAAALQGRALLHRSEDLAENGITKPSTHVGESASVEERTTEQASEDDATQDSQVQSAHE